jgi:hypothetical protein
VTGCDRRDEGGNASGQSGGPADHEPACPGDPLERSIALELGDGLLAVSRAAVLHVSHVRQYFENSIRFQ